MMKLLKLNICSAIDLVDYIYWEDIMSLIDELRCIATAQSLDAELPDALLSKILELSEDPAMMGKESLVKTLITQLNNFDLYAGTGCFSDSCGVKEISDTLKLLSQS
ncbi:MAG: hypothetical protein J0665_12500 [Deltaproteobacteria bacterium]|jgi:hypothetical protein|nr:hypothetical protein [Deltaproteobacteria bacterium]